MFSNSLKIIKRDQNMSELWKILCKNNIILTWVLLLVLLYERNEIYFQICPSTSRGLTTNRSKKYILSWKKNIEWKHYCSVFIFCRWKDMLPYDHLSNQENPWKDLRVSPCRLGYSSKWQKVDDSLSTLWINCQYLPPLPCWRWCEISSRSAPWWSLTHTLHSNSVSCSVN